MGFICMKFLYFKLVNEKLVFCFYIFNQSSQDSIYIVPYWSVFLIPADELKVLIEMKIQSNNLKMM